MPNTFRVSSLKMQVHALANNTTEQLKGEAVRLLEQLIAIPSFSGQEDKTADCIENYLREKNVEVKRTGNNVCAFNRHYDAGKPTIMLNSHHDTVKPNSKYTKDPFTPVRHNGRLYGLGSNDAGGPLVSLIACFLHYHNEKDLKYNLFLAASAEEEVSGRNGVEKVINEFKEKYCCAIVGEPTKMEMAVAEKGLLVIDCVSNGLAGHAARNEGDNAVYRALDDINWFRSFRFERESGLLGPVRMNVTVIETENKAHNVVPATCKFTVDIRVNELYSHEEILEVVRKHVKCAIAPRSFRMRSSAISLDHPIVASGVQMGLRYYGSPTTSDKALLPFPALKIGPGDSARSHTSDEYIYLREIEEGIDGYINILKNVLK